MPASASRMFVRSSTVDPVGRRGCAGAAGRGRRRGRRRDRRPRVSRQSVKPPVEAPTSSTRRPVTSMPKCVEGGVELLAAASDEPRRRAGDDQRVAGGDEPCRLVGDRAVDEHPLLGDGLGGLGAAGDETPSHELGIEAPAGAHSAGARGGDLAHAGRADRLLLRRGLLGGRLLGRGLLGRSPSSPWTFFAVAFFAVAFLAAAFFAVRLLGRRLLRRGPSWRSTWWPRPARPPGWGRSGTRSPPAGPRRRRRGWPASRAAWRPRACTISASCVAVSRPRSRSVCTVASASERRTSPGLDEALHRCLCLLPRHLGELDARLHQLLQDVLGHRDMLSGPGQNGLIESTTAARSAASRATGTSTASPGAVTPERTSANGHPSVTAKAPSVLGRSPTTSNRPPVAGSTSVQHGSRHRRVRLAGDHRPAAGCRAAPTARIAPPPGIGPSGVGYVASSLVPINRAPRDGGRRGDAHPLVVERRGGSRPSRRRHRRRPGRRRRSDGRRAP